MHYAATLAQAREIQFRLMTSGGFRSSETIVQIQYEVGKRYRFLVGTPEEIKREFLKQEGISGIFSYIQNKDETLMLVLDLECYPPTAGIQDAMVEFDIVAHQEENRAENDECFPGRPTQQQYKEFFLDGVFALVKFIVEQLPLSTLLEYVTLDHFAIEEACDEKEGGKLSAHIRCPAVVFENLTQHRYFIYHLMKAFLSLDVWPGWMKFAPPKIKNRGNFDSMVSWVARVGDMVYRLPAWQCTCVDVLIYTKNRTMRCMGTSKAGDPNRFLRPVFSTAFWKTRILNVGHLNVTRETRAEWLLRSLLVKPDGLTLDCPLPTENVAMFLFETLKGTNTFDVTRPKYVITKNTLLKISRTSRDARPNSRGIPTASEVVGQPVLSDKVLLDRQWGTIEPRVQHEVLDLVMEWKRLRVIGLWDQALDTKKELVDLLTDNSVIVVKRSVADLLTNPVVYLDPSFTLILQGSCFPVSLEEINCKTQVFV